MPYPIKLGVINSPTIQNRKTYPRSRFKNCSCILQFLCILFYTCYYILLDLVHQRFVNYCVSLYPHQPDFSYFLPTLHFLTIFFIFSRIYQFGHPVWLLKAFKYYLHNQCKRHGEQHTCGPKYIISLDKSKKQKGWR